MYKRELPEKLLTGIRRDQTQAVPRMLTLNGWYNCTNREVADSEAWTRNAG